MVSNMNNAAKNSSESIVAISAIAERMASRADGRSVMPCDYMLGEREFGRSMTLTERTAFMVAWRGVIAK